MADYINPRAQACQNCVKAKAKCYGRHEGRCERCNRLNRDCLTQTPNPRKRQSGKTIRQAQAGRIAGLEAKLDSLLSILGTQRPDTEAISGSVVTPESITTPLSNSLNFSESDVIRQGHAVSTAGLQDARDILDQLPSIQNDRVASAANIQPFPSTLNPDKQRTLKDPNELLRIFRQDLAQLTPFVKIPLHMDAQSLSVERPFLYQAIMTVSSYHDSTHQTSLGQEFIREITENLVFQAKKNLDLLQGLLVFISWYNALFQARSQLNILLGLAFSLMIDLHLYMPMATFENHEKFLDEMKGILNCHQPSQSTWIRRAEPTKDEKRTILGCFNIFSCASSSFCRINPLQWTPYIQQCYDDIIKDPEDDNDVYLAHLSDLQRISENTRHSGIRGFVSQRRTWNSAVRASFKLLVEELERFKDSLPETLKEDPFMLVHYHAVELYLFEIAFSMPVSELTEMPALRRASILLKCTTSTQAFLEAYFSVVSKPYMVFFTAFMGQTFFAMMTMSKLSLFDAEDWDMNNVPNSINFCTVLERIAEVIEDGSARYDRSDENKPWLCVGRKMRQIRVHFERLLASENRSMTSLDPSPLATQGPMRDLDRFYLFDDIFWQNLADDTAYN